MPTAPTHHPAGSSARRGRSGRALSRRGGQQACFRVGVLSLQPETGPETEAGCWRGRRAWGPAGALRPVPLSSSALSLELPGLGRGHSDQLLVPWEASVQPPGHRGISAPTAQAPRPPGYQLPHREGVSLPSKGQRVSGSLARLQEAPVPPVTHVPHLDDQFPQL